MIAETSITMTHPDLISGLIIGSLITIIFILQAILNQHK